METEKKIEKDTRQGVLVGKGKGTDWMRPEEYRKKLEAVGGPDTSQAVSYRKRYGIVEQKKLYGITLIREPELKEGTRDYILYYSRFPENK